MSIKNEFYEDLAITFDSWVSESVKVLTESNADLLWTDKPDEFEKVRSALAQSEISKGCVRQVISEILRGQIVSFLTIIDGGTALAEKETIELVDKRKEVLSNDLHNEFISHLIDTERLE